MASETARVEAFSDGVFAIAITLLILDVHVPAPNLGPLRTALARQWPAYIAFLISFAFIGVMWVNHHRLFNQIRRSDESLMFVNLLLLLGVCVVPFPTALLAGHYYAPDRRVAAAVFNGTYVFIAIAFNVLWFHAVKANLLAPEAAAAARSISKQYIVGQVLYPVCFALTWVSVPASLALNVALAIFFAIPAQGRKTGRAMHHATE